MQAVSAIERLQTGVVFKIHATFCMAKVALLRNIGEIAAFARIRPPVLNRTLSAEPMVTLYFNAS